MKNGLLIALLCAALPAFALAAEPTLSVRQESDPIGALLRQIHTERQAGAPAVAAKPAEEKTAREASLETTYEALARNLTRAALQDNRAMLTQTRDRVEEMLRAMLAQAAYETGRFQSQLAREAFNYWGMKDRKDVATGRILYKDEYYERFDSTFEGCRGYMQFLARERYAGVVEKSYDKAEFLRDLCRRGWCPKATYVDEAIGIYDEDQEMIDRAARIAVEELVAASRHA